MKESYNQTLRYGITIAALVLAIAHLIWPGLKIDAVSVTLLFIALIPWLSPIFKSLKFPGGWEIQFQDIKEKLDTIVAKETEPVDEPIGSTFGIKAFSVNDEATRSVLKALDNPKYTWRYIGGLMQETKLPKKNILRSIVWLVDNEFATESKVRDRPQWALSRKGRDLLNNILRDERNLKID